MAKELSYEIEVEQLVIFSEYFAPYYRACGAIILPKKGELAEELAQGKRAATQVCAMLKTDVPVTLSGLDDGRRFLVWEQNHLCSAQFPRSGAAMAKICNFFPFWFSYERIPTYLSSNI